MDYVTPDNPNIQRYIDACYADYARWIADSKYARDFVIEVKNAGKFIRLERRDVDGSGGSIHAFIVKENNSVKSKKGYFFKAGDILKAASWKAAEKNFARGNLEDKTFKCARWTGAQ